MRIFRKEKKGVQYNRTQDSKKCKSLLAAVQHPQPLPASSNPNLPSLLPPAPCPDVSVHPFLSTQPCPTSHFLRGLSGPGEATVGKHQDLVQHRTKGSQRQSSATITAPTQRLLAHPRWCWAAPKECGMGCRRCRRCRSPQHSLLQLLLLASCAASSAQHGCKAIFLTNDFVGQRNLRLLLFSYPTVTGYFVVLWTITGINMDRFRAWVLWK